MPGIPNTLTFRLTLGYTATFIIFLVAAFGCSYLLIAENLNNELDDDLTEDIAEYKKLYENGGIENVISEIERDVKSVDIDDEFIKLFDLRGEQIFSTNTTKWNGLEKNTILQKKIKSYLGPGTVHETIEISGRDNDVRIAFNLIGPDMILIIAESLEQIDEILELMLLIFSVILLSVVPLAIFIGWLVVRHSISGIKKVSQAAAAIKNGNMDTRVSVKNQRDEIQNLADTFNSMAGRIQNLMTEMREMIENIAHDLRSPLGRIRVISEMALSANGNIDAYKSAAAGTIEECDRLIQLINISLDVAEVEAGVENTIKEEVDLTELTEDACELFSPVAENKHIAMTVECEPNCKISGNKQNLQRMIANILDNALKYTPAKGKVSVDLRHDKDSFHITITDNGMGIPETEQVRIFDRYYRCDQSRSHNGCGLGLSFARAVAHAHGGTISLTSEQNIKTAFKITLPSVV